MKKINLLLLSMCFCLTTVYGQKHFPVSEFTDTLEYLNQNFVVQKQYYVGKPLKNLWDVLRADMEVKSIHALESRYFDYGKEDRNSWIKGLALSWLDRREFRRRCEINLMEKTSIMVTFEPPYNELGGSILYDTVDNIMPRFMEYIIKDIKLF